MKNFLLINKPAGWTSFDVVGYIRKAIKRINPTLKNLKVGHAGTLDPFATGLLIVGVGRAATRRLDEFKSLPKTYIATLRLGATSDSGDPTGEITESNGQLTRPSRAAILKILKSFLGRQLQIPPMHSAKSVGGTRLYKLARQGKEIKRQPNEIEILEIKLVEYSYPRLKIEIACSAGAYIRVLAEDIGKKLGTGAYCQELTRTKIGEYALNRAKTPEHIFGC